MTPAAKWCLVVGALSMVAISFGIARAPASPDRATKDDAVRYWQTRARTAERQLTAARAMSARQQRAATTARRALIARPSSLEALRLAAISSSTDTGEQQAMYRTLYQLAACESTGTVGRRLPWPPSERVLDAKAQNPTGEHATSLLQFLPSTWARTRYGRAGISIWSVQAQALAAAEMIRAGQIRQWVCARMVRS